MKIQGIKKLISVGPDELSEYDLQVAHYEGDLRGKVEADVFIYAYKYHGYEGSGMAVWRRNGKWRYHELGHCSCYGPTENIRQSDGITTTLPKLLKLLEKEYSYNDQAVTLISYLKKYYQHDQPITNTRREAVS